MTMVPITSSAATSMSTCLKRCCVMPSWTLLPQVALMGASIGRAGIQTPQHLSALAVLDGETHEDARRAPGGPRGR